MLRFGTEIRHFWNAGLHPKRHFVLLNPSLRFRIADRFKVNLVQGVDAFDASPANGTGDSRRIIDKQYGIATAAEGRRRNGDPVSSRHSTAATRLLVPGHGFWEWRPARRTRGGSRSLNRVRTTSTLRGTVDR